MMVNTRCSSLLAICNFSRSKFASTFGTRKPAKARRSRDFARRTAALISSVARIRPVNTCWQVDFFFASIPKRTATFAQLRSCVCNSPKSRIAPRLNFEGLGVTTRLFIEIFSNCHLRPAYGTTKTTLPTPKPGVALSRWRLGCDLLPGLSAGDVERYARPTALDGHIATRLGYGENPPAPRVIHAASRDDVEQRLHTISLFQFDHGCQKVEQGFFHSSLRRSCKVKFQIAVKLKMLIAHFVQARNAFPQCFGVVGRRKICLA